MLVAIRDSGASMHRVGLEYLTHAEKKTIKPMKKRLELDTGSGIVKAIEEAELGLREALLSCQSPHHFPTTSIYGTPSPRFRNGLSPRRVWRIPHQSKWHETLLHYPAERAYCHAFKEHLQEGFFAEAFREGGKRNRQESRDQGKSREEGQQVGANTYYSDPQYLHALPKV